VNSYLRKKDRRQIDEMISAVCSADAGTSIAGREMQVTHADGSSDTVTLLVIRGNWHEYLVDKVADKAEFPAYVPTRWEGSE